MLTPTFDALGFGMKYEIGPRTIYDTLTYGHLARAKENVAIAVWGAQDRGRRMDGTYPSPLVGLYARAVRWQADGRPDLGALLAVDTVPNADIFDVRPGWDNEVWFAGYDRGGTGGIRCGVMSVAGDLTCSMSSFSTVTSGFTSIRDMIAQSWPREGLMLILVNGGFSPTWTPTLLLVNVRTGAIVASQVMPGAGAYRMEEMSFHLESGKVAIWADDTSSTWKIWTVDVTPTSISTPVEIFSTAGNTYIVQATPTPEGWSFLAMPQNSTGYMALHELTLGGEVTINANALGGGLLGESVYAYQDNHAGKVVALTYDESTERIVSAYASWDGPQIFSTQWASGTELELGPILPGSESGYRPDLPYPSYRIVNNVDVAKVGPGRYVFLAIGSYGMTLKVSQYGTYGQVVWLAGHEIAETGVVASTKAAPEQSSQAFRRNVR